MSWLGLLIPVIFLTGYFITYFWRRIVWLPLTVILVASGSFALAAYFIVFHSELYSNGTSVVWDAVSATKKPLVIGGNSQDTVVRWTNKSDYPSLRLEMNGNGKQIKARLNGGGAFLYHSATGKYFNGTEIKPDAKIVFTGNYELLYKDGILGWDKFEISKSGQDGILAGFSLQEGKPRSIAYFINSKLDADLNSLDIDKINEREDLMNWAKQVLIVKTDEGQVFVLAPDEDKPEVIFEEKEMKGLILQAPRQTIRFDLIAEPDNQRITVQFQRPWKVLSPLPPNGIVECKNLSDFLYLTVAKSPLPCESLFAFPFGNEVEKNQQEAFRPTLLISPETSKFVSGNEIEKKTVEVKSSSNQNTTQNNQNATQSPISDINTEKFYNLTVSDCPGDKKAPSIVISPTCNGVTSQATVGNSNYEFTFKTTLNSINVFNVVILVFLIWIIYLCGVALTYERMPPINRWVLHGIGLVIWNLMVFRLILAFRYALDKEAFDLLVINGLTRAFVGLALLPGFFLFLGRLHCDLNEGRIEKGDPKWAMYLACIYLTVLFVAVVALNLFTPSLVWAYLPSELNPSWISGKTIALIFGGLVFSLVLVICIVHIYSPDENPRDPKRSRKIYNLVSDIWYFLKELIEKFTSFWKDFLESDSKGKADFLAKLVGLLLVYVACCTSVWVLYVVARLISFFIGGDKIAQETFLPLFFCIIALFWLGLIPALRSQLKRVKGKIKIGYWQTVFKVFLVAFVTITLSAVLAPVSIGDFGSIIAIFGILMPLCAILVATNFKRAGLPVLLAFSIIFSFGYLFYQNLEKLFPFVDIVENYIAPGDSVHRAMSRTLNFKRGFGAMEYAIMTHRFVDDGSLPYQELLSGNEHIWENQAIAHEGNWSGLGFGKSPNRNSEIRQDTLQYDSVFSFFILSEYGLLGGVLLLLIYLFPVLFVFLGGRERFERGYMFALILASALLLEALYHAGMNLAAFPMSGRNLPLLSVNSPSDLFKWTIILVLIGQAIFWRYEGYGQIDAKAESLIEDKKRSVFNQNKIADSKSFWKKLFSGYTRLGLLVGIILSSVGLTVVIAGYQNIYKKEIEEFSYKPILDQVNYFLNEKIDGKSFLTFDTDKKEVVIDDTIQLQHSIDPQFLREEVARFNAYLKLTDSPENIKNTPEEMLKTDLMTVTNLQDYNKKLSAIIDKTQTSPPNNLLLKLRKTRDENGNPTGSEIVANPDFNFKKNFKSNKESSDYPLVKFGEKTIIAPAWVNNHLRLATDATANMPWLSNAAFALSDEWKRLEATKKGKAAELYGKLTLDPQLQESATKFVTEQGVILHEKLLSNGDKYPSKFPPRVALSIIEVPSGKTLAIGSFPQATTETRTWKTEEVNVDINANDGSSRKKYILLTPSTYWMERVGNSEIKNFYSSTNHNFTLGMLMGSTTKPIFAAAVLAVHPDLDKNFSVQAAQGDGTTAFGLTVMPKKDWHMNSTKSGCITFKDYLMRSDNNYHIRFGLLGLAVAGQNGQIQSSGDSQSKEESMTGNCSRIWGKYPKFDNFVVADNNEISSLNSTPPMIALAKGNLSQKLNSIFGINVKAVENDSNKQREISFRRSFWTKNTDDDLNFGDSRPRNYLFDLASPSAPDFKFDRTINAREYVSMLLGGGNNSFANVDLAGSFATCLLGDPVVPHIIDNNLNVETKRQPLDSKIVKSIQTGLQAAVLEEGGTATALRNSLSEILNGKNKRIGVYAKTGTLKDENQVDNTSRIVFAIIKWKDDSQTKAEAGLVFSLVVEQGGQNKAVKLLDAFLSQKEISNKLKAILSDR